MCEVVIQTSIDAISPLLSSIRNIFSLLLKVSPAQIFNQNTECTVFWYL